MATAVRRRGRSPPSNRRRSCSPATVSSPYFPPELIPEVARRLTSLQDFFALRAACRPYRAALPVTPSNLASQAPLLLLLLTPFFGETEPLALFHLPLGRVLRFRRPLTHGSLFSLGCRVVFWDYPSRSEVRIVHLLTGDQTRLPCPSNDFSSVVLSGSLVLTWSFLGRTIQYCHLETADWRVAAISEPYLLEALICVNGTIYALVTPCSASENRSVYRLAVVNLSDNNNFAELVFIGGALDAQTLHSPDGMHLCLHPAECRGELLLISAVDFHPLVFHIFQWKSGEAKWVRITSLGGCALFFSNVRFVGCLGPDHPGIRKDCMYFNDGDLWHEYTSVDGSFRRSDTAHPGVKLEKDFMLAGWVFPSMC